MHIFIQDKNARPLFKNYGDLTGGRTEMTCAIEIGSDIISAEAPDSLGSAIQLQKLAAWLELGGISLLCMCRCKVLLQEGVSLTKASSDFIVHKEAAHSLHIYGLAPCELSGARYGETLG